VQRTGLAFNRHSGKIPHSKKQQRDVLVHEDEWELDKIFFILSPG
jgi:hypothetical protein